MAIAAGMDYSLALQNNGKVTAWGLDVSKRASVPGTVVDAVAIAASYTNSVVSLRNGKIITFGSSLDQALITRTPTRTP